MFHLTLITWRRKFAVRFGKRLPGCNRYTFGGPLPVISRVVTPLIGVITPITNL